MGSPRWTRAKWPRRVFKGQENKSLVGPQSGDEFRPTSPALPADRHQPSLANSAGSLIPCHCPIPHHVPPPVRGATEQPPRQPRTGRGRIRGSPPGRTKGQGRESGGSPGGPSPRAARAAGGARPAGGSGRPGQARCPHGQGDWVCQLWGPPVPSLPWLRLVVIDAGARPGPLPAPVTLG